MIDLDICDTDLLLFIMTSLSRNQIRADMIVDFYKAHERDKSMTVRHFVTQNVHRSTIYRAIARFEQTGSSQFKPITGRPVTKSTKKNLRLIDKLTDLDPNISERALAKKVQVSQTTAHNMKVELGIDSKKKQSAPKITKAQEERIKRGARKIYNKLIPSGGGKILIMDDETYVPADTGLMPGPQYYCEKKGRPLPDEVRIKPKTKFYKKFLIWQAMDQLGNVSEPYVCVGTMNSQTYLKECIIKRLIPFILKYHRLEDVLFWPDLAKIHYAKIVTEYLESQNIQFVRASENCPNFPHGRPIERFWALVKADIRKLNREYKTAKSFQRMWSRKSKERAERSGKALMNNLKNKLRLVNDKGVYSPILIKLPSRNTVPMNRQ